MKIETKLNLMNALITSGMTAVAIMAVVLITKVVVAKLRNKEEIRLSDNLSI